MTQDGCIKVIQSDSGWLYKGVPELRGNIPGKSAFSTCDLELLHCEQAILARANTGRWWYEGGSNMDTGTYVGMEVHVCTGVENLQV